MTTLIRVLCVTLLVLLILQFGTSQEASEKSETFYPAAVWYSGGKARAPMLERVDQTSVQRWGKDLDQIKEVGFNTVKTWVDWSTAEPKQGEFNFQNLDLLMRLAEQRGLRVIIQAYLDSAPDWVGQKYPDGRFVDRSGAVIDSQSAPGFCIDHDGVRREIVSFLEALSHEANKSPALYGWDVWSEPHVINWADFPYLTNAEFCYCKYSQMRFREWLKAKYKTLDALNAVWYRKFESWDQVEPPRYSTILSYTDYIDWRTFIDDKLAGDLKTRVDAVRTADKTHPITSHAANPALFTSPTDGYGEPDDWKMAGAADAFGTSLYPKHSESVHMWTPLMVSASVDFSRSAGRSLGKGFWIGELQAGQGATGMRIADPVNSLDEQFWIWQVVSHGASEFAVYAWYPMSSGFESNGYGLINLDGSITDRARAAGKTASIVAHHASELLNSQPAPAQVAILFNRLSYMVGGSQESLSKLGNAERDSLLGLYKAFTETHIPIDFIHPQDVVNDRLGQYKIVFLPYPVMLSKDVGEGIARYVQNGGTAVAEARLAWNDERGFASDVIPGFGLEKVFGAKEKVIRPAEKPEILISSSLPGLAAQTEIPGEAFEESLEPLQGSRVLAKFKDGSAAIVENLSGKGKAILIGSFVALAYEKEHSESSKQLMLSLAKAAGVSPDVDVSGPGTSQVEIRRMVSDRVQMVFAFNESQNPADATLTLSVPWKPRHARDWTNNSDITIQTQGDKVILRKNIPPGEEWVVALE
jgi:beta-galactosidase